MLPLVSKTLCETVSWARLRAKLVAPLLIAIAALAGCGGGGGGGAAAAPPANQACADNSCGTVMIGLTDADGDFLSYSVDVVSLTLERANGTTVETLPLRQRVDFAELVDLTEFVTAATIPSATYACTRFRVYDTTALHATLSNAAANRD